MDAPNGLSMITNSLKDMPKGTSLPLFPANHNVTLCSVRLGFFYMLYVSLMNYNWLCMQLPASLFNCICISSILSAFKLAFKVGILGTSSSKGLLDRFRKERIGDVERDG